MEKPAATRARRMRELLASGQIVVSPGVYDGYSARLVERMGFVAASTTGAGLSHSRLGQPDVGLMSLRDNLDACRQIAAAVAIPVMADADNGYGNAVNVHHAVRAFEAAGVVGVNIEDQASPKRCGHMRGKEIVSAREMAKKIEAAVAARRDADFVVNARTDAIAIEGLDGAIARARLYAAAGADLVYPDAIGSEEDIKRFVGEVGAPVSISMGFGLRSRHTTPIVPVKRLQAIGVARVSYSRLLTAAAVAGMRRALAAFLDGIDQDAPSERHDLVIDTAEFEALMGYEAIREIEARFLSDEDLRRKYGAAYPG